MYLYIALIVPLVYYLMTKKKKKECDENSAWVPGWPNWSNASPILLREAEANILSNIKTEYKGAYVPIGPIVGEKDKIWTITLNESAKRPPLVMLHGMGSGVGLWVMNLDDISADRPVYAIDILGFGRSSRPTFSLDPKAVQLQMVAFLEEWRREMKLESFILMGHSFGGYIAAAYAMQYPTRIQHLILADVWGLSEPPADIAAHYGLPLWARILFTTLRPLNPLWGLRLAGPWGPNAIIRVRKNLILKMKHFVKDVFRVVPNYIHQINAQKPSGEKAFYTLMHRFAFSKLPIIRRIHRMHPTTDITFISGAHSWVESKGCHLVKEQRPDSYVDIKIIEGSGHHVNLDKPKIFNEYVLEACEYSDKNRTRNTKA